jgi:peptide/nickel transport system permease protein
MRRVKTAKSSRVVRVGSRILGLVAVLFAVTVLTFGAMSLIPGDPVTAILGDRATQETRAALFIQLGLDRPPVERYFNWLGNALTGDLGKSYKTNEPVIGSILQRLPVTIQVILVSQVMALLVTVPVAVWSARRPAKWFDRLGTFGSFLFIALPPFVLALLLSYVFSGVLHWFPTAGYRPLTAGVLENFRSIFLPSVTLAAASAPVYIRLLRAEMIQTLEQDFILVARSKGLPTWQILLKHALRPSAFSLVTVIALNLGGLIGGALIIEIIFGLPGIGRLLYDAISSRDYIVVQGVVAFIAVTYVLVNFFVDIVYSALDPRVRRG